MMNKENMKGMSIQMTDWKRRLIAFAVALTLLISSCGLTVFAESSEEIYSDPVTAPIEAVEEIEGLVEEVAVVTPDPEEDAESDAEPEEDAGEAAETDEETEPETEAAGEPADLAVYEPGTLTAEIDGVGVTLEYTAEARIPEGALLTLYRVTGGEYFIDMKSTARVLREKQDGIWKREIGDEAVFYHIRLTDAEGTALSPDAGVKLTCTNLSVPAGSTGFVIGANTENIDWDGDLIVDFLPEAIGYVNLRMVQIGTITLVHTDRDYMVTASYGPDAGFPFGTALKVREIMPGTPEYNLYSGMTDEALNEDWSEITLERYFDISFVKDGEELEPQADVDVQITFRDKIEENEETEVQAVHIENNEAAVIESETDSQRAAKHDAEAIDTVTFTSDSFSVFGIVQKKKIVTKILDAQGRTYEIEVTYTQEAEIPEDAQVKVEEIPEGSDMWEAYRIQTAAALNADDVRLPGLYDISIVDAEGHKVDPRAAVNVAIKLLNDDNTSDDIQVVHFKEEIPQEFVEAAVQTQETAEQTEVRNEPLAEEDKIESEKIAAAVEGDTVTFNTDSFSVYAFAYTVDFHYEGVDWSIEGNSQILLSDLIPILNIRVGATEEDEGELLNVADVESVAFTDEHLVTVRQVSGLITYNGVENKDVGEKDFLLSSLEPFTSDEKLIVTLVDGTSIDNTIVIEVTDAQLVDITSLLDSAVITVNGNPVTGDNWNVVSGENYGIKLTFTEKPWFQFPDDNTPMVYKLPAAVQAQSLSGTFSLPISIYGKKYILPDNKYTVAADGTIAIQWNTGTTDEEKKIFGYLKSSDNARIDIDITGSIPSATGPIIFSSTVSKTVNVTEPHDVSISKTGTYNASTGNIDYTVTVNSKGDNSNIIVTDTINGTALTLIHDITASSDNVSTSYNGNSFTSTISSMSNGESITLCYSAHVDKTKIGKSGNATYDETNNSVKLTVTPDDNPSNNEDSTSIHDISFSNFTKEATSIGELTEENSQKYKIVSWEIVMNSNPTVPMAGSKIIDRNGTSWAMAYMDGITVTAYRADGTQAYEKTIAFGSDGLTKNNNDSWEYTIPSADTEPYKYVISYQTKVNVTNRGLDFAVSNYAEGKGGTSGGSYTVGGDGGTGNGGGGGNEQQEDPTWVDLKKTVTYSGIDKISWKIRLIVPAAGYPDGFKLVDYLPSYYFKKNNVNYYARDPLFNETNINSNFNITGLVPGETWNASFIGQSDNDWDKGREKGTFEIVFYKDGTNSGLASTGTDRLIEITYDTAIDEETQALREADYASTGNKEALVHYNETHAYVADVDKANSKAFATPRGQNIVKTFMENTVVGVNGVSRKAALFQIQLTGVQKDEVVIQDIFDTEIFEIAPAVNSYLHLYACGGDSYYSDENMYTRMYGNAVPTSTGANLIIPTTS